MCDHSSCIDRSSKYRPLLTTEEVSELGVGTPKFVRDLLRAGSLPGVKVGGVWRVNRDALFEQLGL